MKKLLLGLLVLSSFSTFANVEKCTYEFAHQYDVVDGCAAISTDDAFNLIEKKMLKKGYSYAGIDQIEAEFTLRVDYTCINYEGSSLFVPSEANISLVSNITQEEVIVSSKAFGPLGDRRSLKRALSKLTGCKK